METQTTSPIDLIVLGLLLEKPMNAYELANLISEKQVSRFLKISTPAVYKSCRRLADTNIIDGQTIRTGGQPEKTVYQVNEKGHATFIALMEHFSSQFKPFYFDCNTFIWNLEKLEHEQGLVMLQNLCNELTALKTWINHHAETDKDKMTFASRTIVRQYQKTISALLEWCSETIEEYRNLT